MALRGAVNLGRIVLWQRVAHLWRAGIRRHADQAGGHCAQGHGRMELGGTQLDGDHG